MMTWSMLARGASSLFYFIGKPPAELWAAQGRCARDIIALTDAATAERRAPLRVAPVGSGVYADFRETPEAYWIIAVNEGEHEAMVDLHLPESANAEMAEIWGEGRNVTIENGILRDSFAPFSHRVYRISRSH